MNMKVQFPEILAIDTDWNGNPIRQLSQPQHSLGMIVEHHQENGNKDTISYLLMIVTKESLPYLTHQVLQKNFTKF